MHVLIFHQYFVSNEHAGATRTYELARRLIQHGNSVTIVTGNTIYFTGEKVPARGAFWWKDTLNGIQLVRVRIPFGGTRRIFLRIFGFLWFIPASAIAALWVRSVDVVVATSTPMTIGIPGYLLSRIRGIPFVFELRDLWPDALLAYGIVRDRLILRPAFWLERFLYRKSSKIIALTKGMAKELHSKGISSDKVCVITNGSDTELFTPVGVRVCWADRAEIPRDAFVCIHAGALVWTNALSLIIDAAERHCSEARIHYVLIGYGPEKPRLVKQVAERRVWNVHFFDPAPKSELPPYLRSADLGLILGEPSRLDHIFLPNRFFDYLASGCPIVTSFKGEASEWLESEAAGVFVRPNDPIALATVIEGLARSPERLQRMRKNARRLAEREFGWDRKVQQYKEVLKSVIENHKGRTIDADAGENEPETRH